MVVIMSKEIDIEFKRIEFRIKVIDKLSVMIYDIKNNK